MSSGEESIHSENDELEVVQGSTEQTNPVQNEITEVSAEQSNDQNEENKDTVKPKRPRNPQPKLNERTLMGPRGLTTIESYFERIKFKGKGFEEQDLNVILKTYEYWCHRLFPKYPFDACIARLETLGNKRATITYLKKIRLGMIEDEDKPLESADEIEDPITGSGFVNEINDQFDQLLPSQSVEVSANNLTDEQLEQITRNKAQAERIRKERLQHIQLRSSKLLQSNTLQTAENCSPTNIFKGNQVIEIDQVPYHINGENKSEKRSAPQMVDSYIEKVQEMDIDKEENSSQVICLSKDQMERIQLNKERAKRIRQEKFEKMNIHESKMNLNKPSSKALETENMETSNAAQSEIIRNDETLVVTNSLNNEHTRNPNLKITNDGESTKQHYLENSDDENKEIDLEQILDIINDTSK